jgi:hypothetical protein
VLRPVPLRDGARAVELVERCLLEPDREGPHRLRGLLRRERREHAGVDAAREQHADRHVRDEVRTHRVAEPRPQLLDELRLVVVPLGQRPRAREPLEPRGAALPDEQVAGRQLAHLAEDRERRRHRVEREERLERVEVDLAARQRAQLRRESELVAAGAVVERLDPEAVAREHEPLPRRVPERDCEHAAQPSREVEAPLLVAVDEHLGVAVRREAMAVALEPVAQLGVVVDLAVLDDVDRLVLVRERLVAGVEVDDRESPRGQSDRAVDERAVRVRPPVDERRAHPRERLGVGPAR